ncbi:MAG: hypothetical protein R2800_00910 [Flavipsychrobacter sp.]
MKKTLIVFAILTIAFTSFLNPSNAAIVIKDITRCNPPPTGNLYDYVGPVTTHILHQVVIKGVYLGEVHYKTMNCDDPGDKDCSIAKVSQNFDEVDVYETVQDKVNNGTSSGHVNLDGTSGTLTINDLVDNVTIPDFGYIWNSTATCTQVVIIDEE